MINFLPTKNVFANSKTARKILMSVSGKEMFAKKRSRIKALEMILNMAYLQQGESFYQPL